MKSDAELEMAILSFVRRGMRASRADIILAFSDCEENHVTRKIDFAIDDGLLLPVNPVESTETKLRVTSHGERKIKRLNVSKHIGF